VYVDFRRSYVVIDPCIGCGGNGLRVKTAVFSKHSCFLNLEKSLYLKRT
jgi:hypothetical protein